MKLVRTSLIFVVCLLVLLASAALAWISHQPNHPWLVRAESWPVAGGLVVWLREAYRPPEALPVGGPVAEHPVLVYVEPVLPPWPAEPGFVWVGSGAVIRTEPEEGSPEVHRMSAITNLAKLEQRGDWYRVWQHDFEGWVHLPGYREPDEPPLGNEVETPRPLLPQGPSESVLAEALAHLRGAGVAETRLGPYAAYTDVQDAELLGLLSSVATQVEPLWRARHGLVALGEPASVVVVYQHEESYRALERTSGRLRGVDAEGFAGYGLVATFAGGKRDEEVAATLVHELCHRIHRRALGPALPPWLEEGMADDLALSRLAGGELDPGRYSGRRTTMPRDGGVEIRFDQGLATLWKVREEILRGHLPLLTDLAALDADEFFAHADGEARRLRYDTMALWVRYLAVGDHGRHREGWQAFLRGIAEGGPVTTAALFDSLRVEADPLEAAFRTWVVKEGRDVLGE